MARTTNNDKVSSGQTEIVGSDSDISVASNATVFAGGTLFGASGGTLIKPIISSGGGLIVSGGYVSGGVVAYKGVTEVVSGGTTEDFDIYGTAAVSSGGVIRDGSLSGTNYILSGGSSYDVMIWYGGTSIVSSGGRAEMTILTSSATMVASSGAVIDGADLQTGDALLIGRPGAVFSNNIEVYDGIIAGGTLASGAILAAWGTAGVRDIAVSNGASATFSSGASGINLVVSSGGRLTDSGGYISGGGVVSGGVAIISSGGTTDEFDVYGTAYVSSGGVIRDGSLSGTNYILSGGSSVRGLVWYGGTSVVLSGGQAEMTILASSGTMVVDSGAVINGAGLQTGGDLLLGEPGAVFSNNIGVRDGVVSGGTLASGARLTAWGTAGIRGVAVSNGANALFSSGASGINLSVRSGGILTDSGGYISGGVVDSGGVVIVSSGGVMRDADMSGTRYVLAGGTIDAGPTRAHYNGGSITGTDYIFSGGTAIGGLISGGGTRIVSSGGITAKSWVWSGGSGIISGGGSSLDVVVDSGGMMTASGGYVSGGRVAVSGMMTVSSGGIAQDVILQGKRYVSAGGGAWGGTITGEDYILSGGSASGGIVGAGGTELVFSGGSASGGIVSAGGTAFVFSGGSGLNLQVSSGGALTANGYASGGTAGSGGMVTVSSGGTTQDFMNYGTRYVSSGGLVRNGIIDGTDGGGTDFILSGGSSFEGVVWHGGTRVVSSGGQATNANVFSSGWLIAKSGALINSANFGTNAIIAASDGAMFGGSVNEHYNAVLSGGTLISGGTLYTQDTATAQGIVIAGGATAQIFSGATGNNLGVLSGGQLTAEGYVSGGGALAGGVATVSSGGTAQDFMNYGTRYVSSGGLIRNGIINGSDGGGTDFILSGGSSYIGMLVYGATRIVSSGGQATETQIYSSGGLFAKSGALIDGGRFGLGATVIGSSGALFGGKIDNSNDAFFSGGTLISGAYLRIRNQAVARDVAIGNEADAMVWSGASAINMRVGSGGSLTASGGYIGGGGISSGGGGLIVSGGVLGGTLNVDNGGNIYVGIGASLVSDGTIILREGSTARIANGAGGNIILDGDRVTNLEFFDSGYDADGDLTTIVNNFHGNKPGDSDTIILDSIRYEDLYSVTYPDNDHVSFIRKDGSKQTLHVLGVKKRGGYVRPRQSDDEGSAVLFEVCFLAGSMIKTAEGEKPVEDLRVDDQVVAFDWETGQEILRKIIWAGRGFVTVDRSKPDDVSGRAVRVLRDALGPNLPHHDLLVTPEHCLFFENCFVPARMLINGRSIFYEDSIETYPYYHIETEQHSVIWANGVLTESLLDTGNGKRLESVDGTGDIPKKDMVRNWDRDAAAPLCVSRDKVELIWRRIQARALAEGYCERSAAPCLTDDPDLYLLTGRNTRIEARNTGNGYIAFSVPGGVRSVRLLSRTARPCDVTGPFLDDRRSLGVLVGEVILYTQDEAYNVTDHFGNPHLEGWSVLEETSCRWTTGSALLSLPGRLFATCPDISAVLSVQVLSAGPYIIEPQEVRTILLHSKDFKHDRASHGPLVMTPKRAPEQVPVYL